MTALRRAIALLVLAALPASAEPVLGDDGLHKAPWMRQTFLDLREDLAQANAEDRRLLVLVEQRGCIYCRKMHEEVFVRPEIETLLEEEYFVVQINMFGDLEVTDLDGTALPEKDMVARWGLLFTPTLMFLPETAPERGSAAESAVAVMPGAFGAATTRNLLEWVVARGYASGEPFQKYHARMLENRQD